MSVPSRGVRAADGQTRNAATLAGEPWIHLPPRMPPLFLQRSLPDPSTNTRMSPESQKSQRCAPTPTVQARRSTKLEPDSRAEKRLPSKVTDRTWRLGAAKATQISILQNLAARFTETLNISRPNNHQAQTRTNRNFSSNISNKCKCKCKCACMYGRTGRCDMDGIADGSVSIFMHNHERQLGHDHQHEHERGENNWKTRNASDFFGHAQSSFTSSHGSESHREVKCCLDGGPLLRAMSICEKSARDARDCHEG